MGAPVDIRQRATDNNSGVNTRGECLDANAPVATVESSMVGI